ncbi:MAG: M81 family metallopeptidase, partial [Thermoleophilia bacterium]|nr:M81 family metallopeptidase [Thermoleophilia bacterium]
MSGTLFFSSLVTETSSFTNLPTTFADYAPSLLRGADCLRDEAGAPRPGIAPLLRFAEARGWDVVAGITCHSSV